MSLAAFFPPDQWEHGNVRDEASALDRDVPMFRLKGSELRIIIMPGVEPGTRNIIGVHVLFRAHDDSMNMHMECPGAGPMLQLAIKTAVKMSGKAPISHRKFIDNFVSYYQELCEQGRARPLNGGAQVRAEAPPMQQSAESATHKMPEANAEPSVEQDNAKRARVKKDEPNECSVCMAAPADTLVLPCGHSVVCAACSKTLAAQAGSTNRERCVVCREPISHVAYPDNSLVATK